MNGALPPSSSETFFSVPELSFMISLPTSVEPVTETFRTIGLVQSSLPTVDADEEVSTFSTPFGMPARSASSASASAESGVSFAGLITEVQPTAIAGPTLRVIMAIGKFHGVIAAVTPIGSLRTMMRRPPTFCGITSP